MVIAKIYVDGVCAKITELRKVPQGIIGATIEVTYQIRLNSFGYYEKGVLTEEDLAEIDSAIEAQYIIPEAEEKVEGI